MKKCSTCHIEYSESLQFCPQDGTPLLADVSTKYNTQPATLPLPRELMARPSKDISPAKYIFLDVVGFTNNRSVEAQADIINDLNSIVRDSLLLHNIPADRVIYIPTGDGICIALLNIDNPFDIHMKIAIGIIERINKHNATTRREMRKFQVRIGINANTDNLVTDINGQQNVAGAGISMAARIMDKADGNQILVGRSVYDTLSYREKYTSAFKGYQATVKHGTVLDVYQFVSEDVPGLNTEVPEAFKPVDAMGLLSETELSTVERIISLQGTEAKLLPTAEGAFQYMAERVTMAKRRIDHAALAPPIQRVPGPSDKWEEAISNVLTGNKVNYRYIALLTDPARSERIKRHLSNPHIHHYYVKYYKTKESATEEDATEESVIPALSFILIDKLEVIMHYPYEGGNDRCYLSIKHPEVGKLFFAYYERLWIDALKFRTQ